MNNRTKFRKIKLRAWNIKEKRYLSDLEFQTLFTWCESPELNFWLESEDLIIEQYTGILDINKKEICEGDILSCSRYTDEHLVIVFLHGAFVAQSLSDYNKNSSAYFCGWTDRDFFDTEIIGNIHEFKK